MRELIVNTFLTLDGVMQAPGGPGEDDSGGFAHGGWSVTYWDERMGEVMDAAMRTPFDLVLGRTTYDIFAAYWPNAPEQDAKPLNDATTYVASPGKRLFGDGTIPTGLRLVDSEVSTTGVVIATYEPVGEVPIGTFELD